MFETATLSYGPPSKRVWATAMGFTGQAVLIGCAVLAPLISPQTLGRAFLVTALVTPRRSAATAAAGSEGRAAIDPRSGHPNLQEHPHRAGQYSAHRGHDRRRSPGGRGQRAGRAWRHRRAAFAMECRAASWTSIIERSRAHDSGGAASRSGRS